MEEETSFITKLWRLFDFMPEGASTFAPDIDWLNNLITNASLFCTVAIVGAMLYFAIRYKDAKKISSHIHHNLKLEIVWTVIPTLVCLVLFYYGFSTYSEMRTLPTTDDTIDINVDAYSWRWEFKHITGKQETNELVVPVNKPIKLIMKSHDVLHSFFIPAMRIKEDVLPSEYHFTWFQPVKIGEYPIFCTEYCGTNHSAMRARLKVVSDEDYQKYLKTEKDTSSIPPLELGKQLYTLKGCVACHSIDGTKKLAPTFQGIYGRKAEFTDGTSLVADENYLRESILNPMAKVVQGYNPIMPSFEGQLNEDEIQGLIAYLKSLKK